MKIWQVDIIIWQVDKKTNNDDRNIPPYKVVRGIVVSYCQFRMILGAVSREIHVMSDRQDQYILYTKTSKISTLQHLYVNMQWACLRMQACWGLGGLCVQNVRVKINVEKINVQYMTKNICFLGHNWLNQENFVRRTQKLHPFPYALLKKKINYWHMLKVNTSFGS